MNSIIFSPIFGYSINLDYLIIFYVENFLLLVYLLLNENLSEYII